MPCLPDDLVARIDQFVTKGTVASREAFMVDAARRHITALQREERLMARREALLATRAHHRRPPDPAERQPLALRELLARRDRHRRRLPSPDHDGSGPPVDRVSLPDQPTVPQAADHLGRAPCAGELSTGAISPQGWANPASGHLTSPFGYRIHPITGQHHLHTGSDVANACGSTPVYAAADGVVIWQGAGGYQGRTGNQIVMDHDGTGGVITRYGHVLTGSILVRTGDHVTAGQQIASIGGDPTLDPQGAGGSTGCHLHFEVNLLGIPVDAREHLASHGVQLGS